MISNRNGREFAIVWFGIFISVVAALVLGGLVNAPVQPVSTSIVEAGIMASIVAALARRAPFEVRLLRFIFRSLPGPLMATVITLRLEKELPTISLVFIWLFVVVDLLANVRHLMATSVALHSSTGPDHT